METAESPPTSKQEHPTMATVTDQHEHSALRLISSTEFTPEMAVIYLYQWRNKEKLIEPLLGRL